MAERKSLAGRIEALEKRILRLEKLQDKDHFPPEALINQIREELKKLWAR